jgi:hypothetical protein
MRQTGLHRAIDSGNALLTINPDRLAPGFRSMRFCTEQWFTNLEFTQLVCHRGDPMQQIAAMVVRNCLPMHSDVIAPSRHLSNGCRIPGDTTLSTPFDHKQQTSTFDNFRNSNFRISSRNKKNQTVT